MNAYVDVSFFPRAAKPITSYKPFWAKRFGPAPFLPMSRTEMQELGWDSCDVILVTGDAYIDHPSFGMSVIGRTLEAQGFRVGIISQPDWHSAEAFEQLGRPNLFWGVTAGNMDSMINRYTADRKIRSDDAYTPGAEGSRRPDRAAIVYSQRCREAYKDVPIVLGGMEGSLRRIAHYDYWSDKVRRSIVVDSKCDLLLFGNAERALVEIAHRLAARTPVEKITDVRGTAFIRRPGDESTQGWFELNSTQVDQPGPVEAHINPYQTTSEQAAAQGGTCAKEAPPVSSAATAAPAPDAVLVPPTSKAKRPAPERTVIRLPSYEQVKSDPVLYAHASRVFHLETNPGNARALVQAHGEGTTARDVWLNPPPVPLTTPEMDHIFGLPYARSPHPRYADAQGRFDGPTKIPAWEVIRFSINIMRGCFGGCTFCSITEHEGRIIQSRSEDSILREIEDVRDKVQGFTGTISDLGGPTANMYRLGCRTPEIEAVCRKPSCVYPDVCQNLTTNHDPLINIYRKGRAIKGIKKILIGSGLRYDLAIRSPEYVKELVQHHVGGYLKIAPEHTESGPLTKMMKPGIGNYDKFKVLFEKYTQEAGKKQYLIPYFIAAHPGTSDEDMMHLAVWLKKNGFRADQVQTFYPSTMASATAMYHTGINTLKGIHRDERCEKVDVVRGEKRRRLHKAFLRYHDPANWPLLREALKALGRADLIGNGKHHLIPSYQPLPGQCTGKRDQGKYLIIPTMVLDKARQDTANATTTPTKAAKAAPRPGQILTQHSGLPPRAGTQSKRNSLPNTPKGQGVAKPPVVLGQSFSKTKPKPKSKG